MPSKRVKQIAELVEKDKLYDLEEALVVLKKAPKAKFDESVELAFDLNVNPKQSDQMVRGTLVLPHGSGKEVRVLVFCRGEKQNEAKEAGADIVGDDDLIKKVSGGWLDFDVAVATPDMMKDMGRLGKVLGPRGLMPSPKAGTVTMEVGRAVKESKAGKVEFKVDRGANILLAIGKISFSSEQIIENAQAVFNAVKNSRPHSVKGHFIKNLSISTTMGPGLKLNINKL
ncbi:MAG: 50S ribosomal protein L1 [Candidatus Omnitrophota bacterium]